MAGTENPGKAAKLRGFLDREARLAGFDAVAVTPADTDPVVAARLAEFVAQGRHGTMTWMAETAARRQSPQSLWPDAKSVIMLGMNYGPEDNPLALLERRDRAAISVYARHRDYHDVIKGRLKTIAQK